jgi:hypothetical protein
VEPMLARKNDNLIVKLDIIHANTAFSFEFRS